MVNSSTCTLNPVLLECIKRNVWTLLLGLCPLLLQQYQLFLLYFILIFPRSIYTYYNCSNETYVYVYIFYISTHVFVICPLNLYLPCPYILLPSATDLLLYFILYWNSLEFAQWCFWQIFKSQVFRHFLNPFFKMSVNFCGINILWWFKAIELDLTEHRVGREALDQMSS